MDLSLIAFSAFATIALVGSLLVILRNNPVSSAFALILVFVAFAGIYALLGAHLVAALQILVYTGAIMVLFVFVIMLLNQDEPVSDLKNLGMVYGGLSVAAVSAMVFVFIQTLNRSRAFSAQGDLTAQKIEEMGGNLKLISEHIFTDYLFQFEITSFLLLGAIVSTVTLSKRRVKKGNV